MFNSLLDELFGVKQAPVPAAPTSSYSAVDNIVNSLRVLCQQGYYNPHASHLIHQQAAAALASAFYTCPPPQHDWLASSILSGLLQFPFQASQLRGMGPMECARRYPLYSPVIYGLADVLMPGWRQGPPRPSAYPLPGQVAYPPPGQIAYGYPQQQPMAPTPNLQAYPQGYPQQYPQPHSPPVGSPVAQPRYEAPSPSHRTTYGQTPTSTQPTYAAQIPVASPPPLPARPVAPALAQLPTQSPASPPGERSIPLQHPVPRQLNPAPVEVPYNVAPYAAKPPDQQRAIKEQLYADATQRGVELDGRMEEILQTRRVQELDARDRNLPRSPTAARQDQLVKEMLDKTQQRDEFMSAAVNMLQNPGMNAQQLASVIDPLRNHIRDTLGEGIINQLDGLLLEQAQKEETTNTTHTVSVSSRSREGSLLSEDTGHARQDADGASVGVGVPVRSRTNGSVSSSVRSARVGRKPVPVSRGSASSNAEGQTESGAGSTAITGHIRRIRSDRLHARWREFGQYVDALTTEDRAHPEVALELGRTLFAQGWARKALEAVEVAWVRWGGSWPDRVVLNALRLLMALLNIVCDSRVKEALGAALAVRKIDEELGTVERFSQVELAAENFHYKIMQRALAEGFLDEEIFRPILIERLRTIAQRLQEAGRMHDALAFSLMLSDTADSRQDKEDILRPYLRSQNSLPVDKADVCLELAAILANAPDSSEAAKLLQDAEDAYKQDGHLEGELKARLKRLEHVRRITSSEVQAMLDLADAFANLPSPSGQTAALNTARSAVFQLYPDDALLLEIHERSDRLHAQTGNKFFQLQENFAFSSALIMWPKHIGKAVEALHRYVDDGCEDLPQTKGQLATFLGQAYMMMGDREKSLRYAKLAVQAFQHGCNYEAQLNATWGLANALTQGEVNTPDFSAAIRMLEESAEVAAKHNFLSGQVRAYETLVTLEGMLALHDSSNWYHQARRDRWAAERQKINHESSRRDPIDKIRLHLTKKEFEQAEELAAVALDRYVAEGDSTNAATCHHLLFSCRFRPFDASAPRSPDQMLKATEILVRARKAVAAHEALGPNGIDVAFIIEISLAFEEIGRYLPQRKAALYTEALRYLELGEAVCEKMRESLPSLAGLPDLLQKRILVSYKYHLEIYTRALRLAAATGDAVQVWKWTQKSKAKALSDMVASRSVMVPGTVTDLDLRDEEAVALLEQESKLIRDLESASAFESISLRTQLDQVREQMNGRSALGHLLQSRAGKVELHDLGWIFDGPAASCIPRNRKIVLVDWVIIDDAVVMLTVDNSLVPRMTTLDLTWSQVRLWKRKHLASDAPLNDPRTDQTTLDEINGLVTGLEHVAARGDFLVLCPSIDLHAIPLHALKVDGWVLIVRNIVTYTTSLSLLRLCCERATAKAKTRSNIHTLRAAFVSSYDAETGDAASQTELPLVVENVKRLALDFGSEPHLGADANRGTFRAVAQETDILHYHGHMDYRHNDMLHHGLVLSGSDGGSGIGSGGESEQKQTSPAGTEPVPNHGQPPRHNDNDKEDLFTVRDVFALRLDASLATMIACSSGVQDIAPGDEPIGLLAALLYAGCATSVGTLWPVASSDGRYLARAFYQDLRERMALMPDEREAQTPLNMAISFCRAVRRLSQDTSREHHYLPYHWAPFVMHGAWFI